MMGVKSWVINNSVIPVVKPPFVTAFAMCCFIPRCITSEAAYS